MCFIWRKNNTEKKWRITKHTWFTFPMGLKWTRNQSLSLSHSLFLSVALSTTVKCTMVLVYFVFRNTATNRIGDQANMVAWSPRFSRRSVNDENCTGTKKNHAEGIECTRKQSVHVNSRWNSCSHLWLNSSFMSKISHWTMNPMVFTYWSLHLYILHIFDSFPLFCISDNNNCHISIWWIYMLSTSIKR